MAMTPSSEACAPKRKILPSLLYSQLIKSISFWCELGEAAKKKTDSKNDAKNKNNKTIVNQG
jgi:hypothetical protein